MMQTFTTGRQARHGLAQGRLTTIRHSMPSRERLKNAPTRTL
jgi:hypothetical protein